VTGHTIVVEVVGGRLDGALIEVPVTSRHLRLLRPTEPPSATMRSSEGVPEVVATDYAVTVQIFRCEGCGKFWVDGRNV
jgi:hypothetical protein